MVRALPAHLSICTLSIVWPIWDGDTLSYRENMNFRNRLVVWDLYCFCADFLFTMSALNAILIGFLRVR
jgi:hypothetical protein